MPEGYSITNNTTNNMEISNGTIPISFSKYDDSNITKHVDLYIESKNTTNSTVEIKTFEINNLKVYKSTLNDSSTVHYWFNDKTNVYEISSIIPNPTTNSIIENMINNTQFIK